MRREQLRLLRCLSCDDGELIADEGTTAWTCASCGAAYPIVNGVARFVQREHYAQSFGLQWNVHRRTQLDNYTSLPISRNRLFQVSGWPQDLRGQTIMERIGRGSFHRSAD